MNTVHPQPELLLVLDDEGRLNARAVRLWDRLWAWLLALSLDRRLAAGTSADSSALLSLRARTLLAPRLRSSMAAAFSRLASPWAQEAPRSHVSIPSRPLNEAHQELELLSARLSAGPVSVRGVAQAHLLLTDGSGPLYLPRSTGALRAAAQEVIEALDPWAA